VRERARIAFVLLWLAGWLVAAAAPAAAGPFARLQVLLPGESAAPGTVSGKTGTPRAQTAGTAFDITVRACDMQWNTVATVTDAIQILSSDQSALLPTPAQLVAGTRIYTVTLNAAGTFTLFAHDQTDGTIPDGSSSPVSVSVLKGFRFSIPTHDNRPRTQTAGVPFTVTIDAVDPADNLVRGFSGTVSLKELTNFGDGLTSPSQVTLSAGTWTGSVTVYRADLTVSRGANLYAWLPESPTKDGSSTPFNVNEGSFARLQIVLPGQTPVPGSATGISGTPSAQVSGTAFTVGVYATDTWWNPVSSGHSVRITSSDQAASAVSGSLSNGYRALSVTLRTVGLQTLTATDQSSGSILGMTSAPFPVLPNAAHHFAVSTIASPQTAGSPVAVTIRAVDQAGNTIPTYTGDAVLLANTGAGSITPEFITFTAGVWTGTIVFRGAGAAVEFTVADFANPPHTGASNRFAVQPGPLAALQVLLPGETAQGGTADGKTGVPTGQTAGSTFIVTVRAVDAFWNLVPGASDSIAVGSSDAFATLPSDTTLVGGQILIPVRLYATGGQRIWAGDLSQPSVRPDTSSATNVTGGPFSRLLVLAPGESPAPGTATGRTGAATDQSINYAFTVTVLATDSWWNPVSGPTDLVHLTTSDPLATLPADAPLVNGRADLNLRLATGGFQQILVSDPSAPAIRGSSTQVRAISTGFHLEATISPAAVRAGDPFTLSVKVTNDAGSVIQEINSFITVTVRNAASQAPGRGTLLTTQFQLLQGQRAVTESYSFSEPIVLVVRDDAGNAPGITGPLAVSPGPAAALRLTSDPSSLGGNKHATLSALLQDAYGNGVPGQPMGFSRLSGTGTLTPIDAATDSTGVARADFLSPRVAEHDLIRASSGSVSGDLDLETALVDPGAPEGTVTNYPNPFHPGDAPTTIAWKLADRASVTLRIFSQGGTLVREQTFASGATGGVAGLNSWNWDGRNGAGAWVASGGYLVLIEAQGSATMRRKIALVR